MPDVSADDLNDLERKFQAQLLRQEHRLFSILHNAWVYRSSEDALYREAAMEASFDSLTASGPVTTNGDCS